MATVTSHLLDAVRGRSAAGVTATLIRIAADGSRSEVFKVQTDEEGRIDQTVAAESGPIRYELNFETTEYFGRFDDRVSAETVVDAVVVRFAMPVADKRYHIPVIASPYGYSLWWSA